MFEQLCSWDNLFLAYQKASRGKRGQANVAQFEYYLEENLINLRKELLSGNYQPGGYYSFYIHEPKHRLISAASFRDRVVHHALCNMIEPIFEKKFSSDSYANRIGKGTHRAIRRAQILLHRYRFRLSCDICQFFPSIDHELLKAELQRYIGDCRIHGLVGLILESGKDVLSEEYRMVYFPGDDLLSVQRERGLPIGNLTSQFWANVYLNPFDHFIRRELGCKEYVRYVDDFVLFSNSKEELWNWKNQLERRLSKMRLIIHPGSHPVAVKEGLPFLGFQIYPEKIRLKRRKVVYFGRKLRNKMHAYASGIISMDQLNMIVRGWVNHASFGDTAGLRKKILHNRIIRRD